MQRVGLSIRFACFLMIGSGVLAGPVNAGYYSDNFTVLAKASHSVGGYIFIGQEQHRFCQEGQRIAWAEAEHGRTIDSGCWSYDVEADQIRIAWLARAGKPDSMYEMQGWVFEGEGPNLHRWIIKQLMQVAHPVKPGLKPEGE